MNFKKNTKTREIALQILYSLMVSNNKNIKKKTNEFKNIKKNTLQKINTKYLFKILNGTIKNIKYINNILIKNIDKKTRYIGLIEKYILYMAIYEIKIKKTLPLKVIINENIELIKKFGSKNDYKLINSILHKICFKKKININ